MSDIITEKDKRISQLEHALRELIEAAETVNLDRWLVDESREILDGSKLPDMHNGEQAQKCVKCGVVLTIGYHCENSKCSQSNCDK